MKAIPLFKSSEYFKGKEMRFDEFPAGNERATNRLIPGIPGHRNWGNVGVVDVTDEHFIESLFTEANRLGR